MENQREKWQWDGVITEINRKARISVKSIKKPSVMDVPPHKS
jgi:hypothetical protein